MGECGRYYWNGRECEGRLLGEPKAMECSGMIFVRYNEKSKTSVRVKRAGVLCALAVCAAASAAGPQELSARTYSLNGATHGVVVFQVNWGRKWGCAGIENA